jgi:hypothetical protein
MPDIMDRYQPVAAIHSVYNAIVPHSNPVEFFAAF